MVTNYTPDKCRYTIGKLVKSVWLISENAIKDIRIDNGEAWVNSISETPIRIDCTSVGLQEEESLDERYRFVHTLTFSVNGYANSDDFQGKYYAIVKDNNGTYWLVNPLFPCKVTYVYTLSNDENHTDFTLSTASNHPVLRLNGMVDARAYECKEYFIDGISELWLNEKRYSVHDGKDVKYTNDGFKVIDYNKNSATFTETFDGTNTSHSISFDVLFSSYKSSWHYNLLEFIDECIKNNNLYSAIIKTRNGKYAMCGFSYGLQPSFNINADDTTQEINKVQISLQDVHTVGDPIDFYNSADYTHLTAKTWVYTDEYDGYICVGDGLAKYLLQKEIDALGNDTCNYKALTGYENNFPELNIVGTFSGTVTFTRNECSFVPCMLSTSIPRAILFTDSSSKTYTLRSDSNWTIIHDDDILVTPDRGSANEEYTVTVRNIHTPTAEAWITNMKVLYCVDMEYNTTVTVVEDENACFRGGPTYYVTSDAQTLSIQTQCCVQSVKEKTGVGTISTVYNDHITVYIPENDYGYQRTIILLAELCDGSVTNLTIIQNVPIIPIYRWNQTTATTCIGDSVGTIEDYFTISGGGRITFSSTYTSGNLYYSQDSGNTWNVVNGAISNGTGKVIFKGVNLVPRGVVSEYVTEGIGTFSASTYYKVGGNIMSLVAGDDYMTADYVPDYFFVDLLSEYKLNIRGHLLEAIDLFLPATKLGIKCYSGMFAGSFKLTKSPALLPAMTLSEGCYSDMFLGCTHLTTTPKLLATTLAKECYYHMFSSCTSLETVPSLPATTLAERCYQGMFDVCTSLTTVPANLLPATTLKEYCYYQMFSYCSGLTSAPDIVATAYAPFCCKEMFDECSSLSRAKISAPIISPGDMANMFRGTSPNGVLQKNASVIIPRYNIIPSTWSVENI